jgi:Ca-activated chloride channel family protein
VAPTGETEVAIQVTGLIARTRVTQVFHNPGAEFVEGLYVFPLPEKAAVDHLWMRIGERVIEGRSRRRRGARVYEKARAEGGRRALVEQQRPNLFTNSVAHIGPDEMRAHHDRIPADARLRNGEYRLRFPLAVTPRYTPPRRPRPRGDARRAEAIDAAASSSIRPMRRCGAVNPVDIVVVIDAGVPLGRVESSYHEAWVEKQGGSRTMVSLAKEQEEADRDFELVWTLAPLAAPQAAMFVQSVAGQRLRPHHGRAAATNAAELAAMQRIPREVILIADTSGSMQGSSMQQAKAALIPRARDPSPRRSLQRPGIQHGHAADVAPTRCRRRARTWRAPGRGSRSCAPRAAPRWRPRSRSRSTAARRPGTCAR